MRLPVDNARVTSGFGERVLNGKKEYHAGVDFVSRERDTVYAIANGVVSYDMDNYQEALRWIDRKHSLGNFVIVDHIVGKETYHVRYCHLKENLVAIGQKVVEGDVLGHYADVGLSFGPHLHIDAFDYGWKVVNIEQMLKEARV